MKAVILAGGYGTRLSEESGIRPKPMVEIGGKPILWHIMKIYSYYGIDDFIICTGYKGNIIKEYFANYFLNNSDVTFDMRNQSMEIINNHSEPWKVTVIHTGQNTMTGGRLKRVRRLIGDETFCMTYGDGLSDVDISKTIEYHKREGRMATLTAVQQPGRFGIFILDDEKTSINHFQEKPHSHEMPWINGGFFVLEPDVMDYIDDDDTIWERKPLELLARDGQLTAYRHQGFWQPMDTLRDKNILEEMWQKGKAPWYDKIYPMNKLVNNSHLYQP